MKAPPSIHEPITPQQASALPAWYWNIQTPKTEMTKKQIWEARRTAQRADAQRRQQDQHNALKADAIKAGVAA